MHKCGVQYNSLKPTRNATLQVQFVSKNVTQDLTITPKSSNFA